MILEDWRDDIMRGLSEDAVQEKILIEWNAATKNGGSALQVVFANVSGKVSSMKKLKKLSRWLLLLRFDHFNQFFSITAFIIYYQNVAYTGCKVF